MSCYFVAQITIHDRAAYTKYLDGFDDVFAKYKGTVVAVDEHPVVLEGSWPRTRFVLIRFPDATEARRWYDSDEYRALVRYRHAASVADVFLVEGRE